MRKLSKKISMLMVLAMLVSLFSGIVSASAASAWSFASSKYDVEVKETITMEKNEYADFGLLKDGEEVTKATYTVKWASSDEDVVWVNAKTGQLRADKFGVAEAGDKAKISATFTNVKTKKSATRYFYIEIADDAKYEIAVNFGDEAFVVGQKYDLAATVKADGKEVEAKVEFSIDGKAIDAAYTPAEAGEVTIVAVATVDGKEVAKAETKVVVAEAGLVSAKQITFDTVALTFGSADVAKAVAANTSKIGSVYYIDKALNEVQAFIEKAVVDADNAAVVNVTLYNNLIKNYTYKFTYADKSFEVKGADLDKNTATYITFNTTALAALNYNTNAQKVLVNFFNADDILIAIGQPSKVEAMNHDAYNTNGNLVFFHKAGATAILKATYYRGYAADGTKIPDLVAEGSITSYDAAAYGLSNITDWTLGTNGLDENNQPVVRWSNWTADGSIKLAIGENKILGFRLTKTPVGGGQYNVMFKNKVWSVDDPNTQNATTNVNIWYESSNENVVLVDKTLQNGTFYPVGPGNAQIIVYRCATYDNSWNRETKEVIGVFNVEVVTERVLTTAAPSLNKNTISTAADDFVKLYINAKDQTGEAVKFGQGYTVSLKLMPGSENVTVDVYQVVNGVAVDTNKNLSFDGENLTDYLSEDWQGHYFMLKVSAGANADYAVQAHIGATVSQPAKGINLWDRVVTLNIKSAATWSVGYRFVDVKNNIDINFLNWDWNNNENAYKFDIKLGAYDAAGYLYDIYDTNATLDATTNQPIPESVLYAGKTAAESNYDGSADVFYYTIIKNGNYNNPWTSKVVNNKFSAITGSGTQLVKDSTYGTGTYVINAYRIPAGNSTQHQFLTSTTVVVTDSTPVVTAVKLDNKLTNVTTTNYNTDIQAIFNAPGSNKISLVREGKGISATIGAVDAIAYVNPSKPNTLARVNVQKVYVLENIAGNTKTTGYWVDVYFSYEIQTQ